MACIEGSEDFDALAGGLAAVKTACLGTCVAQLGNLITHEGNEGRNHDSGPGTRKGGGLEADRLSPTGGKDEKGVAFSHDGSDGLALEGTEGIVSPNFAKDPANDRFRIWCYCWFPVPCHVIRPAPGSSW